MKAIAFIFIWAQLLPTVDTEVVFNLDFSHKLMIIGINFSLIWIFFRWLLYIDDLNLINGKMTIAFLMIEKYFQNSKMFQSWQKYFGAELWTDEYFAHSHKKRDEREVASSYVQAI